jgi:hypothetical protein
MSYYFGTPLTSYDLMFPCPMDLKTDGKKKNKNSGGLYAMVPCNPFEGPALVTRTPFGYVPSTPLMIPSNLDMPLFQSSPDVYVLGNGLYIPFRN